MPSGYRKTVTRKDRRQPDRLDLRGKLSDHAVNIAVAIDISGSMTDTEIDQAMVEIFSIVKDSAGEVTVIECDSEVRRAYKAKDKKDIRKKLNTRGGTRFSPVFKYMREQGMRNYLLIYFTDGLGENELDTVPNNYKILWVITGKGEKLSLIKPYGEVKRLSNVRTEKSEFDYAAKNELRDMLVEWAK
jgi:predicted metal-dependent peptidase